MKAGFVLMIAFVVLAGSASYAQKVQKTKKLMQEEVPVAVVQSLEKDFSSLTEKGSWKLVYKEDLDTRKMTPELYTYSCKNGEEKVEIFFKPDGSVDHAKGIAVPAGGTSQK